MLVNEKDYKYEKYFFLIFCNTCKHQWYSYINIRMEKLCYVHLNCLIKIIARDNLVVAVVWQLEMNKLLEKLLKNIFMLLVIHNEG